MKNKTNILKKQGRPQCFCRAEVLDKAMKVFCEMGYEAASVAQLCDAMNMKPPSLYNAFGDKEGLFLEVLTHYHAPFLDSLRELFLQDIPLIDALKALFDMVRDMHSSEYAFGCLIANSSINVQQKDGMISSKIKSLHEMNERVIHERLEKAKQNGELKVEVHTRSFARYLNSIIQGVAVLARGQQTPEVVNDIVEEGMRSVELRIK